MSELINSSGYDIPADYLCTFCFEGLYNSSFYYAEKLKNNKNKKKVREENKKACHLLAKAVMSLIKIINVIKRIYKKETTYERRIVKRFKRGANRKSQSL